MERIYNQALTPARRHHVRFMEHLNSGQSRNHGTYNVQFGYRSGDNTTLDGVVEAEIGGSRELGSGLLSAWPTSLETEAAKKKAF